MPITYVEADDAYGLLQVARTSSPAEIKAAFKLLAAKLHPDKHPGDPTATGRFQRLNAAYSLLKSPETRAIYDKLRANHLAAKARTPPPPRPPQSSTRGATRPRAKPRAASTSRRKRPVQKKPPPQASSGAARKPSPGSSGVGPKPAASRPAQRPPAAGAAWPPPAPAGGFGDFVAKAAIAFVLFKLFEGVLSTSES